METFQVVWSDASLGAIVRTLYGHRSKALHEGRPFPLPMCVPPFASDGVAMERPFALSGMGGQWAAEDRPIHLHVFAYWVRHALLMWWDEMIDTGSGIEDATPATPAPPS